MNELQKIEEKNENNFNFPSLISEAVKQGGEQGLALVEKMMDLRDREEKRVAKKMFDQAMADFQQECPVIQKTKTGAKTNGGAIKFKYADLGMIVLQVKDILSKNGFSYSIKTEILENKNVKATCIARHIGGFSDESCVVVPVTEMSSNIMTPTQATASATTFAKRYAFCDVFGILTADEDTADCINSNMQKNEISEEEKRFFEEIERKKEKINNCQTYEELKDFAKTFTDKELRNQELVIEYNNKKNFLKSN